MLDTGVLAALAARADRADASDEWPAESWRLLGGAGVSAWSVPAEFGGRGLSSAELLAGYERLAGACLTTAFILSQREAAVRRLVASPSGVLRERFLPSLACGEFYASVGLSQLTTSRQHQAPAFTATPLGADGFRLDGAIPWVTGADQAGLVVVGATLPDGRQVLLALPAGQRGVAVEPPLSLMALTGSRTAQVRCEDVRLGREWLLAGPAEKVMGAGGGGVGGLETSCLALGLAGAAVEYLQGEAENRSELAEVAGRFGAARHRARARLHGLAEGKPDAGAVVGARVDCTLLVLRSTQAALTVAKGAGFVAPHPAQRWARQALFFLVWSCPRPAAEGVISHLLPPEGP
jgi:alkylation response protein AidB-like acyl-CoA dehydrogenase